MRLFKLTDRDGVTRRGLPGETRWVVGETVAPTGDGYRPCGPGVLHLYGSPEEAVLYDPIHANYYGQTARLFEVEVGDEGARTDGAKWWTGQAVRVISELPLPVISITEMVSWAICLDPHSTPREWAVDWLSGHDRSTSSAWAVGVCLARAWAAEAAWAARSCPTRSLAALARARAILAGTFPAERYDELLVPYEMGRATERSRADVVPR